MVSVSKLVEAQAWKPTICFPMRCSPKGGEGFYSGSARSITDNVQPNASAEHPLGQRQHPGQTFEQAPGSPGRGRRKGFIVTASDDCLIFNFQGIFWS